MGGEGTAGVSRTADMTGERNELRSIYESSNDKPWISSSHVSVQRVGLCPSAVLAATSARTVDSRRLGRARGSIPIFLSIVDSHLVNIHRYCLLGEA